MATKKLKKEEQSEKKMTGEYFYAVGKRKTSVAQVKIFSDKNASGEFIINGRNYSEYFPLQRLQSMVKSPLVGVGQEGNFAANIKVSGGGFSSQAEAVRLGLARALIKYDAALRKTLRDLGFLTRDARIVERKKPGLKKARRAPQWAKR